MMMVSDEGACGRAAMDSPRSSKAQKLPSSDVTRRELLEVAAVTGGGGGGRPEFARAGGRPELAGKLDEALARAPEVVRNAIK